MATIGWGFREELILCTICNQIRDIQRDDVPSTVAQVHSLNQCSKCKGDIVMVSYMWLVC